MTGDRGVGGRGPVLRHLAGEQSGAARSRGGAPLRIAAPRATLRGPARGHSQHPAAAAALQPPTMRPPRRDSRPSCSTNRGRTHGSPTPAAQRPTRFPGAQHPRRVASAAAPSRDSRGRRPNRAPSPDAGHERPPASRRAASAARRSCCCAAPRRADDAASSTIGTRSRSMASSSPISHAIASLSSAGLRSINRR